MPGNLAYRAYHLIWSSLDWLFPPDCGGCGKKGERWCSDCQSKSQIIGGRCCTVCGDISVETGICRRCREDPPLYTQVRSWALFQGPVRSLVHQLKYKNDICLGEALAQPMILELQKIGWPLDLLMPVPLSLARMAERGYNQAALIAFPIAIGLNIPYTARALMKVRNTRSQVGLRFEERKQNLANAFTVNAPKVNAKRILIVDDVTTTGSTLNECARILLGAGAKEVYGYTFARSAHNRLVSHAEEPLDLGNGLDHTTI